MSDTASAADKQQFYRLTEAEGVELKLTALRRGESGQTVAATIARSWLHGLITDADREALTAGLPVIDPADETAKQIYRLPAETAIALKGAFIQRGGSQQSVVADLVRAWVAGHIDDDQMRLWRDELTHRHAAPSVG